MENSGQATIEADNELRNIARLLLELLPAGAQVWDTSLKVRRSLNENIRAGLDRIDNLFVEIEEGEKAKRK